MTFMWNKAEQSSLIILQGIQAKPCELNAKQESFSVSLKYYLSWLKSGLFKTVKQREKSL